MKSVIQHYLRSAIDWRFRRQRAGLTLATLGVALCGLLLSPLFQFRWLTGEAELSVGVNADGGILLGPTLSAVGFLLALILIGTGLFLSISEWLDSRRRKIIVIECRGLRSHPGRPLEESLPRRLQGKRDGLILDIRNNLRDGEVVDAEAAVSRLGTLPHDLAVRTQGLDRKDVKLVVGALAPVPFVFYLGCLLDDEEGIELFDWDRHGGNWRELSEFDDGQRFVVNWPEESLAGCEQVLLAVSASYGVDIPSVGSTLPGCPRVEMDLDGRSTDSHWSKEKQVELGRQFLDVAMRIGDLGVRRINLFLAAPASLVLRLGMLYDRRNLPEVLVYQYERKCVVPYPWSLRIPNGHETYPEVIQTGGL